MRGVKVWGVEVKDGNGDTLEVFAPFLSQQAAEEWLEPRKKIYPELYYDLVLFCPPELKWTDPVDPPWDGLDRPKCEDCGEDLTLKDIKDYWNENGTNLPRCCSECAEKGAYEDR